MTSGPVALVFAGGAEPVPADLADLGPVELTIAADSGFDHATRFGYTSDVLVGDLDSISPEGLEAARAANVEILEHAADKDRTDLELALEEAQARGAGSVIVVGGHGGRLDHLLVNVAVLTAPHLAGIEIEARMGGSRIHVVRRSLSLGVGLGTLLSILAVGGPARGVTTRGLRWELSGGSLEPGSGRGVSNEVVGQPVEISLEEGALLVVQPGPPAP